MNDKQQLQAMGEHQAEYGFLCFTKQIEDLQARLQECANGAAKMQEQRDRLASQLEGATAQCWVVTDALREARQHLNGGHGIKYGLEFTAMFERIDAALAGKLPDHVADASKMVPEGAGSRALFERWFRRDYHPNRQGPYIKDITWAAWQAALAAAPKLEPTK